MAACTATPISSSKGGDDVYLRHDPLNDCHLKALHSGLHGADGVLISKDHGHQNSREWDRHNHSAHDVIVEQMMAIVHVGDGKK